MSLHDVRRFVQMLVANFRANRCSQVASSLAFTTLLSLVPLVTLTIVVFGGFPVFEGLGQELRLFLVQNLLPEKAGRIIATYALQFSQKAANLTLLGSALLALGAFTLILTIDRVFNQIWGVRHPRRWTVRIPLYWATLTIGPLLVAGAVTASSFVLSASLGLIDEPVWVRSAAFRSAPFVLLAAFFTFLYRAIPNRPVKLGHALVGGVAAAALLALVQKGLTLFIAGFSAFTLIYGTFTALPIFLLWLYLSWVAILAGALIASTLPAFVDHRQVLPSFPGDQAFAAIKMLRLLVSAQAAGSMLSSETLHDAARVATADGELLLEGMREEGWIARSDEGTWLLAVPAERLTVADVLARFAVNPQFPDELETEGLAPALAEVYGRSLAAARIPIARLICDNGSRRHVG
jgi:membrane protein